MKLIYLSNENLRNTAFIKDLVFNYKNVGKSIILHDHFGSEADTRFVTKRISALMSEEMITNNAISGDQRGIFTQENTSIRIRKEFLLHALMTVDLLVINPLGIYLNNSIQLDPLAVAIRLRDAFRISEIHLFPKNSRSPLVATRRHILEPAEAIPLRAAYEEEALVLDNAIALIPVFLGAPGNFLNGVV